MQLMRYEQHERPSTGAPKAIKQPTTETYFTEMELRRDGPAYCGPVLSTLPEPSTLTLTNQTIDPTGSKYCLVLGSIRVSEIDLSLWAYLTSTGQVDLRCGTRTSVTPERHHHFKLKRPFCYLTNGSKILDNKLEQAGQTALEALILFYFVTAGKWSPSLENERIHVSLPALKRACEQVYSGTAVEAEVQSDLEMEWESASDTTENATIGSSGHIRPYEDEFDYGQAAQLSAMFSATVITDEQQQLEAEINTKKAQLAELSTAVRNALRIVDHHSWLAHEVLAGRDVPEVAREVAKDALGRDIGVFGALIDVFRAHYEMEFAGHL